MLGAYHVISLQCTEKMDEEEWHALTMDAGLDPRLNSLDTICNTSCS